MSLVDRRWTHDSDCPFREDAERARKLNEELRATVKEHVAQAVAGARAEGYRAGIEAAAGIAAKDFNYEIADAIRALAPAKAPP